MMMMVKLPAIRSFAFNDALFERLASDVRDQDFIANTAAQRGARL